MLLLIAALVMVLLLSGCRTRISNNTEVASTISDEDGWLQETYQMRRDDLDMPVAKKPFIVGTKDEELEGYDDEFERDYEDFDSDIDREEEEEEADSSDDSSTDTSSTQTTTSSSSSTSTRRTTSSPTARRRTVTTRRTSTTKKKSSTKTNTNTSKNTDPPKEEQPQEQPQEQPKKQFTISFDGNGVEMEGETITVEEGGTYGSLPVPPQRDDYTFDGWFTEKEGGQEVTEGSAFSYDSDQTLYAHWTQKDPTEVWANRFDIAANDQIDKLDCMIPLDIVKPAMEKVVDECKGNRVAPENSPKCIIVFASKENVTDEGAQSIFDESSAVNPALEKVIIISDDSVLGDDNQKLFYKLALLDAMHSSIGQDTLDAAASELGVSEYFISIYTRP